MEQNPIFYTQASPQMLEATKQAQSTFKYFWRELSWERRRIVPALNFACVKLAFQEEDPHNPDSPIVEFMWLNDIDFDGFMVNGILINDPDKLTTVKAGSIIEISPNEISDWLFAIGEKVGSSHKTRAYGGFTIQAMRAEMNKSERKEHDEAWGIDFGDVDKVLLAYEQDKHPENLIEHPMSINMGESLKGFIAQHPNELTHQDEQGYTLLHREAIAGNKTSVEILLQMGADANIKTKSGHTALDFAKKMEWEHLFPVLGGV